MSKEKKIPQRMCVVCRTMQPKTSLLRIVRSPDNRFFVDGTGKANGRGAYVCDNAQCMQNCIKKHILNKAFKENVPEQVYEDIWNDYVERQGERVGGEYE